jgi:molecular chaperone HscB
MYKEDLNPFEILGIETAFELDPAVLDKAYFARQALVHPDRFVYHSEPERKAATIHASSLNQAYEILKNPMLRAKALLKLRGIEVGEEEGKTVQNPKVLQEMIDLQETLMAAISPHDFSQVQNQIHDRLQTVMTTFGSAIRKNQNQELPALYLRLTYLSKLLGNVKVRQHQSSVKVL